MGPLLATPQAQILSPPWTSLEIARLLMSALTPLAVVVIGFWVNRIAKRLEAVQWANQKIIEKRLALYEELAPPFNDLLCFYAYIGNWKELSPDDVIRLKRKLDKRVHVVAPLFSPDFLRAYNSFMGLLFEMYAGWGSDAKLRTSSFRRSQANPEAWNPKWDAFFSEESKISPPDAVRDSYLNLMTVFSNELRLGLKPEILVGKAPTNWGAGSKTTVPVGYE